MLIYKGKCSDKKHVTNKGKKSEDKNDIIKLWHLKSERFGDIEDS